MGVLNAKYFGSSFVQEVPTGTVDGTNATFTLGFAPAAGAAVVVSLNGLVQQPTVDYTLSGQTITMLTAPDATKTIQAYYLRAL